MTPWRPHTLQPGEVLCFGSNWNFRTWTGGFHGLGSALLALCGPEARGWRGNPEFEALRRRAETHGEAPGAWWAALGAGYGWSQGARGQSLALPSVVKAGARRSIPLWRGEDGHPDAAGWSLQDSLELLRREAARHPERTFVCLRVATGLGGWRREEVEPVWAATFSTWPPNLIRADPLTISPALLRAPARP